MTITVLNAKTSEVDNKISDTGNLVTTIVLNIKISEVENKIANNSKYITTQEFNQLRAEYFAARLKEAYLVTKTDFDNNLTSFNRQLLQIKQNI